MSISIDRINDDIATLDIDGNMVDIDISFLPPGAKEGDLLAFVTLDSSEVIASGKERISRMQAASSMGGGTLDI